MTITLNPISRIEFYQTQALLPYESQIYHVRFSNFKLVWSGQFVRICAFC